MALFTLLDLARKQPGFPEEGAGWKLIVHTSTDVDLRQLVYADLPTFEYFQRDHNKPVYNCDHIVSCVKLTSRTAMVIGAYDIDDRQPLDLATIEPPPLLQDGYAAWRQEQPGLVNRYTLGRNPVLDDLVFRVIIEVPTRGMKLNSLDRDVVGLRQAGCVGPCPDYEDIEVSIALLRAIYANEDANSAWRDRLSAVGGIYLLTDHRNHRLYVGKTDARTGFWDRWRAYADGRTGNLLVDPAFARGELHPDTTTMSILDVIPRGSANERTIQRLEHRWMRRLQTRETGYNAAPTGSRVTR